MKTADVKKLPPLEQFLYWIRERHQVHVKRLVGKPKPWTDDEVLQRYFFTNPYREHDKVTTWFRKNVREPLRNDPAVLMATIIFRWFNLPSTGEILLGLDAEDRECGLCGRSHRGTGACSSCGNPHTMELLTRWNPEEAFKRLDRVRKRGEPVFTGAFMINSPAGKPKLEAIIERIDNAWADREQLYAHLRDTRNWASTGGHATLQGAHAALLRYPGLGGFMAYEVVCDLRYTHLLWDAPDVLTWCNPGPGAIRGLLRLLERPFEKGNNSTSPPRPKDWDAQMIALLAATRAALPRMPPFEMREIEHSLCEWDKYMRALSGDGRMKRTYQGV